MFYLLVISTTLLNRFTHPPDEAEFCGVSYYFVWQS